jgi:hypothetical protein
VSQWYEEIIINAKEKYMKKVMSLALLCAALAVPIQSDGWVAVGGRGWGGGCWHGGWGCGGVSTGTAVAAGFAGLAAGAAIGAAAASPTYVVAPSPVVVTPAPIVTAPVVVPPAIGAIYYSLPYGAQSQIIRGQQYYVSGSFCYKPYFGNNGVYYEVVPYPI